MKHPAQGRPFLINTCGLKGDMSREESWSLSPSPPPRLVFTTLTLYIRWGLGMQREENYMDFELGLGMPFYNLLALIWASVSSSVTYHFNWRKN